jgi:CRP-like cAMP-binding protein/predicted MFS family arabinose efflux permease
MVRVNPLIGASESGRMPSGGKLLHNSSLVRLLAGFGLLNASEWGFVTALSIDAFRRGGTLYVGLIGLRFLAGALSSALFAPLFASRRGVLSVIALMRAAALGVAAALTIAGSPFVVVLVFVVIDSIVAAAYRPAQSRLMPSLARSPQELTQAVAGTSMAKTIGQAAGALIGGAAVDIVSPGAAMAGEAGLMLLALLCTLGIGGRPAVEVDDSERNLRAGLAAFPGVLRDANAWPLVVASMLRTLVRGLWGALLVVVALHLLHASSSSVGLLQAATGIGAFIALPITASQIGRARLAFPCIASFVCAGITVGLISTAPALPLVVVLVCLWGASMALADATSLSLLHRLLSTDAFSRTVAVMESLKLVSEGAGALLAPALVALFGLRTALVIAGLPLPVLMITTWVRIVRSDELAAGRGRVVGLLHRVSLFRGLDMASLEQLAAYARPVAVSAGDEPITQGDQGDRFYLIESGDADVLINGFKVQRIGPGADFGERALLRDTPRTATVRAVTDMELLAIERDAFLEALTGEAGLVIQYTDLMNVPLPDILRLLPTFRALDAAALRRLSEAAQRRELVADSVVFDAGDESKEAYVILSGRVELRREDSVASVLVPGDIFGELSLLHGTPWPESAVVTERTVVAAIPAAAMLSEVGAAVTGRG